MELQLEMMKAVIVRSFGGVDVMEDTTCSVPKPHFGEVRVRLSATSFNPIDVYRRNGRLGGELPIILGRDFAGIVDAVGTGVPNLKSGDQVYGYQAGLASNGSYAEYLCLPADLVARAPRGWSAAESAALPVAGLTAFKAVHEKARLTSGQAVLVAGAAGGVGSMIVQLAQASGAHPIIVTAGGDQSAALLTNTLGLPPEAIIRYRGKTVGGLAHEVLGANAGRPVAVAFDTAGGAMKRLCFEVAEADGQIVSIVEEPADFDLNIWDEATSPMSLRSLSFHFVELSARARSGYPDSLTFYRETLDWLTAKAESGQIRPPTTEILGPLCATTARMAHARLETGSPGAKLVMTIENSG